MRSAGLIAATALFAGVVSLAAQNEKNSQADREWFAPPSADAKTNPLAKSSEAVAGGRKLFHQRCGTCHGDDARGTSRAPDLTAADVQAQSDGALFWKITSGNTRTGMPTFSFLPELQRWQLVLHIRAHAQELVSGVR